MAYDQEIERRIDRAIRNWNDMEKKRMFGGICYLLGGNMCFGIWKEFLIVRLGAEQAAAKLREERVHPFDVTGKPMKGWVMVGKDALQSPESLEGWIALGRTFAGSLPPK